ncbi:MAG: hypothetical protein KBB32_04630 [Spirochaetia bacterium]|nr:hypothetical protein [Spirochaetia bacterium]
MLKEALDTAGLAAGTAGAALDTIGLIASRIEKWNSVRRETSSVIRLLYLEVCKDLDLLAVLIDARDREVGWSDPRIRFFISNFETGVMEMVLMGNEKEDVYRKLSSKGRIKNLADMVGVRERSMQKYENVLQALRFVYVKMDILRKLALAGDENDLLKRVKVIERLRNIEARLALAKRILGGLEENKALS